MTLDDVIRISKAWNELGGAIQEQAEAVARSGDLDALIERGQLNPNALRYVARWLDAVGDADRGDEDLEDEVGSVLAAIDDLRGRAR